MSTAGKVLTVLVMLVMAVWLVMISAVTQLNINWEQKIAGQQKSLDQATDELSKARSDTLMVTEQARAEQDEADRDVRVLLTRIAGAEARKSRNTQILTRTKAEVADLQAAVETANANLATREAEKIKTQENLARTRDEIVKAQALNADLKSQLAQLQADFKRIVAENAEKLARLTREGAARPASSIRTPPPS